jgi:hypothetical protein
MPAEACGRIRPRTVLAIGLGLAFLLASEFEFWSPTIGFPILIVAGTTGASMVFLLIAILLLRQERRSRLGR